MSALCSAVDWMSPRPERSSGARSRQQTLGGRPRSGWASLFSYDLVGVDSSQKVDLSQWRLWLAARSKGDRQLPANRPMVRLHRDMPTVDPMRPRRGDEDDGIDANLFRRTKPPQRKSVPQRARPG